MDTVRSVVTERAAWVVAGSSPIVFGACVTVAGFSEPGYSHVSGHISGLASEPAYVRWVAVVGFLTLGIGLTCFAVAVARRAAGRVVPVAMVAAGIAVAAVGAFPRDCVAVSCADPSWHHRVHDVASVPVYAFAVGLPLLVARRVALPPLLRRSAAIVVGASALLMVLFVVAPSGSGGGAIQRATIALPLLWLVATCAWFAGRGQVAPVIDRIAS